MLYLLLIDTSTEKKSIFISVCAYVHVEFSSGITCALAWVRVGSRALAGCVYASAAKDVSIA